MADHPQGEVVSYPKKTIEGIVTQPPMMEHDIFIFSIFEKTKIILKYDQLDIGDDLNSPRVGWCGRLLVWP